MKASFTGILKLSLNEDIIEKLTFHQEQIMDENPEYQPLPKDKLHITLIHQSIFKKNNAKGENLGKALSNLIKEGNLPEYTNKITLSNEVKFADVGGKQSYYVEVENQELLREYINLVMSKIGGDTNPEPERVFHISLCNKTGSPFDSVAKVWEGKFVKTFEGFKK